MNETVGAAKRLALWSAAVCGFVTLVAVVFVRWGVRGILYWFAASCLSAAILGRLWSRAGEEEDDFIARENDKALRKTINDTLARRERWERGKDMGGAA